jgi:hypothetical protein
MSTIGLIRAYWYSELVDNIDSPPSDTKLANGYVALYTVAEDGTYTSLTQMASFVFGLYSFYYEAPRYDYVAPLADNKVLLTRDPWYMEMFDPTPAYQRTSVIVDLGTGATTYSAYAIRCRRPLLRSDDGRVFIAGEATLLATASAPVDDAMTQGLWEVKPDASLELVMEGPVEVAGSIVFEGGRVWSRSPTGGANDVISQLLATGESSTSIPAPREIPLMSSYYDGAVFRNVGPYSSTPSAADIVGLDSVHSIGPPPYFQNNYQHPTIQTFPTLEAALVGVDGNPPVSLAPIYAELGGGFGAEFDFLPLMRMPGSVPAFVPKWKSYSGVTETP